MGETPPVNQSENERESVSEHHFRSPTNLFVDWMDSELVLWASPSVIELLLKILQENLKEKVNLLR